MVNKQRPSFNVDFVPREGERGEKSRTLNKRNPDLSTLKKRLILP